MVVSSRFDKYSQVKSGDFNLRLFYSFLNYKVYDCLHLYITICLHVRNEQDFLRSCVEESVRNCTKYTCTLHITHFLTLIYCTILNVSFLKHYVNIYWNDQIYSQNRSEDFSMMKVSSDARITFRKYLSAKTSNCNVDTQTSRVESVKKRLLLIRSLHFRWLFISSLWLRRTGLLRHFHLVSNICLITTVSCCIRDTQKKSSEHAAITSYSAKTCYIKRVHTFGC